MESKKIIALISALFVFQGLFGATAAADNSSSTPGTAVQKNSLQMQIQERAKKLEEINSQLEATKNSLKDVQSQKTGLQKDVKTLDYQISQLGLNIQSDEVTSQKLGLEIQALNFDLSDIETSITGKKEAVVKLLQELQKSDNGNLLVVFLKNKTLSESVSETKSLDDIRGQLLSDMTTLKDLKTTYSAKLADVNTKKEDLDFHEKNLKNRKVIAQDQKQDRQTLLTQTKNQESLYQKQLADLTKQQQQIANEIEELDMELRSKIDPSLLPTPVPGVLAMPIATTKDAVTQDYGATAFAKYGYRGKWHNGIDIGAPIGTPVFAAEDGVVDATGNQDAYCYRGAYGRFITINHSNNLTTLYAHLSRVIVAKGQTVKRGELIGYVGRTGYATGAHLHFTVFAEQTYYMGPSKSCGQMPYGGDLNPLKYL